MDLDIPQIIDRLLVGVVASVTVRLPWRPGAWELLAELRALGVPCALVSMSWKPLVDAVVGASPEGSFAAVVSGDQVRRGKPDPEPYLAAAALLGAPIAECVAIEDSATGMRSAWASGARTIVVPHVVPVPHLAGVRRLSTLSGVSAADLATLTAATA